MQSTQRKSRQDAESPWPNVRFMVTIFRSLALLWNSRLVWPKKWNIDQNLFIRLSLYDEASWSKGGKWWGTAIEGASLCYLMPNRDRVVETLDFSLCLWPRLRECVVGIFADHAVPSSFPRLASSRTWRKLPKWLCRVVTESDDKDFPALLTFNPLSKFIHHTNVSVREFVISIGFLFSLFWLWCLDQWTFSLKSINFCITKPI